MATVCMYTYFLYHRLPMQRGLCLQAFCLLTTNRLSRNIHHLMYFYPGWRNARHTVQDRGRGSSAISPHPT